jgi:serine/threonine-protein kinase
MLSRDRLPKGHPYVLHPERDASPGHIYSSSFGANTVTYYNKGAGPNNPVAGSLTGSFENPEGMAVDKAGNLYVTNSNAKNVLVYPPGATSASLTLTDPNGFPDDIAFGSDGTAYVANLWAPMGNPGSISVYPPGATTPSTTLNDQAFVQVVGVALDKHNNVFVSYDQTNGAHGTVVEFRAGSSTPTATNIVLGSAGGIGFDKAGRMLVIDQAAPTLNVYHPGSSTPATQLPLPGASLYFSWAKSLKRIYVADYALGEIDVFDYTPAKLTLINTITNGIVASDNNLGIATTTAMKQ